MLRRFLILSTAFYLSCGHAAAASWQLPPDKGVLERDGIAAILGGNDYPETSGFRKQVDYIDFESHGQQFTQVVVTLTPDKPRLHKGRKLVVVGGEPGSEYAMDFLETPEGKEGPAIWLAKRGRHLCRADPRRPLEFLRQGRQRLVAGHPARIAHADLQPRAEGALDRRRL